MITAPIATIPLIKIIVGYKNSIEGAHTSEGGLKKVDAEAKLTLPELRDFVAKYLHSRFIK